MSTEEYYKAKNTGQADTRKPGAGLGLAEYSKKQAAQFEKMEANQAQAAGSRAAGEVLGQGLGLGFINLFYYLGAVIFLIITSVDLGAYLGFGESHEDFPD